jgi:hypothetical protein
MAPPAAPPLRSAVTIRDGRSSGVVYSPLHASAMEVLICPMSGRACPSMRRAGR